MKCTSCNNYVSNTAALATLTDDNIPSGLIDGTNIAAGGKYCNYCSVTVYTTGTAPNTNTYKYTTCTFC